MMVDVDDDYHGSGNRLGGGDIHHYGLLIITRRVNVRENDIEHTHTHTLCHCAGRGNRLSRGEGEATSTTPTRSMRCAAMAEGAGRPHRCLPADKADDIECSSLVRPLVDVFAQQQQQQRGNPSRRWGKVIETLKACKHCACPEDYCPCPVCSMFIELGPRCAVLCCW